MSVDVQKEILRLKLELSDLVDAKLKEIGDVANAAGLSATVYSIGPLEESLYLVNQQFLSDWGWEESDLERRDIEFGDWIPSAYFKY